jgi:uncharacterized protein YutE (UPF0331/DUF86 family)
VVDKDLIYAKASAIKRHCKRITAKSGVDVEIFKIDLDRQESVLFNLQKAIQNCIDIAAHIVSEEGYGVPGSSNELFYLLEEHNLIDRPLTEKMVRAIGLRNLIAHEYGTLDLEKIHHISKENINDLDAFIKSILGKAAYFSQ